MPARPMMFEWRECVKHVETIRWANDRFQTVTSYGEFLGMVTPTRAHVRMSMDGKIHEVALANLEPCATEKKPRHRG